MKEQKDTIREEWKEELRDFYDKNLKAKKPTMKNLEREILVDFVQKQRNEAYQQGAKDKVEEIIREVEKNEWFELNADWDYIKNEVIYKDNT